MAHPQALRLILLFLRYSASVLGETQLFHVKKPACSARGSLLPTASIGCVRGEKCSLPMAVVCQQYAKGPANMLH